MIELISPFPFRALPQAWRWLDECRDMVADDFAPQTLDEFVDMWDSRPERLTWAVSRDGELGGIMSAAPISPIVWDMHLVFSRAFWGQETTRYALSLALDEVFRERGACKISAAVFPRNHALLGMIRSIGATKEGLLRGHTLKGGKPVDMVIVGLDKRSFYNAISSTRSGDRIERAHRGIDRQEGQQDQHERRDLGANQLLDRDDRQHRQHGNEQGPDSVPECVSAAALDHAHESVLGSLGDGSADATPGARAGQR